MAYGRFTRPLGAAGLCAALALGPACSDGPSGPRGLDVSGSWIEVSTLLSDTCGFDFAPTSSVTATIVQTGNQITFVFHAPGQDFTVPGTFNPQTGDFTLTLTITEDGVTGTQVQSGRFSSSSRYTSETTIVITDGVESCTVRFSEAGQRRT